MRALWPAAIAAALLSTTATPAWAASVQLALSGPTAQAGSPEVFTITRVSGGASVYVLFQTADRSARAGTDYTATKQLIYLKGGQKTATVSVPTFVNPKASGTLTFSASAAAGSLGVQATASIVEPAAPPPPAPPGDLLSPSLTGLQPIPDNFDTMAELQVSAAAPSGAPDLGAFRFQCGPGQIARDDPIVYPGQPGKSHLHQFFGNTLANASSTYESLRTTGDSTCMSKLNRSGYWVPALLDGKGHVVRPDIVSIYYKRWPKKDPHCNAQGGYPTAFNVEGLACLDLPNGLRFIFGANMLNLADSPTGAVQFMCEAQLANYETMTQALDRCRANPDGKQHFIARIEAPNCWDGHRLDSANHRSHVAYATYGPNPDGSDGWGYLRCPTTHPYVIPTFTMTIQYSIDNAVDDTHLWHFSSDEMVPGAAPGVTFHGDWFGAWSPDGAVAWQVDGCIEHDLNCNSGNLGNGYGMKNFAGVTFNTASPRLVSIP
jgi:hypothetical protein